MKKVLLSALLSLVAISGFAQAEHLSFLGVKMGSPLKEFYQNILAKGFANDYPPRALGKNYAAAQVRGVFAGQEATQIMICANGILVDMVIVTFPAYETWNEAKAVYLTLWDGFTKKYKIEKQTEKGDLDTVGDKCSSVLDVVDGRILLELEEKDNKYVVSITYADKPGNGRSTDRDSSVMGDI